MRAAFDNEVLPRVVRRSVACQHDRSLKTSLTPSSASSRYAHRQRRCFKLVFAPRKVFMVMVRWYCATSAAVFFQ
jgi:hypothetical protein